MQFNPRSVKWKIPNAALILRYVGPIFFNSVAEPVRSYPVAYELNPGVLLFYKIRDIRVIRG